MNELKEFLSLGLSESAGFQLEKQMILTPTDVQEKAIPILLENKDILVQAKTGTGKTLAFLLPVLEKIDQQNPALQALILAPTRELAIQVTEELKKLQNNDSDPSVLSIYGGQDLDKQIKRLARGVQIAVATPGRLLDHVRRETIDLSTVSTLIIDEADQMLHFGFLEEVEHIIELTSEEKQMGLFSATLSKDIRKLAKRYMNKPETVQIRDQSSMVEEIQHYVIEVSDREKLGALCQTIDEVRPFLGIIFCRTIRRVSKLYGELRSQGYLVGELHGDLSQSKRENVMKQFRTAKLQLLVATDVASRGIDIEGVTHVFNYDVPEDVEGYIHRIGRTGRAGEDGAAYTLSAPKDKDLMRDIEQGIQYDIPRKKVEVNAADYDRHSSATSSKKELSSAKERKEEKIEKNKKRQQRYSGSHTAPKPSPSKRRER
ncbi:DEAD/DEAH box helicase [Jeotgalibacillus campisalis]|uniref:RNA helicase n=1 Tax=Jeotgalibacillus campisalis TaxID=220754 RepID=A0A0C2V3W7_9BACL|nr:DEAD/DEAH box helicase [Jeotgalibacillus campisalis]